MSSVDRDATARVGTVIDQRFRIERLLGVGGMGTVYVATASNGHRYALKLLLHDRLGQSAEMVARFVREAKLAASVDAANVVHTYECAVDGTTGTPYIVMELLDGSDVDGLLETAGPLPPAVAVRIVRQAALGLAASHAAGIIHRDIKPANLFLHRRGDPGPRGREIVVKVCDFGIAKAIVADNESLTVTGTPLGTPLYLSPEQMRSAKHVDVRTDVWSLGMSLWTMLTGRSAMADKSSLAELFLAVCTQDVPWLQDAAPWIDPALARIVHGALLRDLPLRCPNLEAFARALSPFSGGDALFEADLVGLDEAARAIGRPRGAPAATWAEIAPAADAAGDAVDPTLSALVGRTLVGRYRLERLLGAGGMGAVYEALTQTGDRVAVKVILGDPEKQKPEMLRRFVREARATMAVDSPNVVRIVDVDTDPQQNIPFIVMDLLSGTDLDKLIRQRGALEPAAVVSAFLQACSGLGAAHTRGILHRDVKPANVYIHRETDGRVCVKICDFGIAKQVAPDDGQAAVSTELTRTGGVLGSPMYMSPEQARSAKHVDATSDVWSLGAALYEALSGRRVWEGHSSIGDLIIAICTKEVPPLQDAAPWIEPGLAEAVHKALQRDPAARHASMEAFAKALAPFASQAALTAESLVAVSDDRRAKVAPRSVTLGGGTSSLAASSFGATGVSAAEPVAKRRGAWVAVAAVVLLGGVASLLTLRGAATTQATANAASAPSVPSVAPTPEPKKPAATAIETASVPAKLHVAVRVSPKDALVTVDGNKPVSFADGVLDLEGEKGDAFRIVAKVGARSVTQQVFIGKDGKPSLDLVEVPATGAVVDKKPTKPGDAPAPKPTPTTGLPKPPPTPPAPTSNGPLSAPTF